MSDEIDPAVRLTIYWSVAGLAGTALAALVTSLWLGPTSALPWHVLCWFSGVPVGFALGLLSSPLGKHDKKKLTAVGQVVAGFLSGFVISKIEKIYDMAVERGTVLEPTFLIAVALFSTAALATAISVFLVRAYLFTE